MQSRQSGERPIFWQRGIAVLAAPRCYAKITPAALQRGNPDVGARQAVEDAGHNPKFAPSETHRVGAGAAPSLDETPRMAPG
jgi:hypothetical protein